MATDRMRTRRRLLFAFIVAAPNVALAVACGSRTGLILPYDEDAATLPDAAVDVLHHFDARPVEEDALEEEALPPLDVTPPPPDAPNDCPDAASTLVYVITESNNLYSFYPPAAAFTRIGTIACPAVGGSTPFSMAVDRNGIAYIVFNDGELFRVSTATAACQPTSFIVGQHGFSNTFGMAFSHDTVDGGETLFIASDSSSAPQLGSIDVTNYQLTVVGAFNPPITAAELTGTGAGALFGFWSPGGTGGTDSAIVQIDKSTAQVTNSSPLPGVAQGNGWAFAFWGGDFYTFGAPPPNSTTVVTRFSPSDGSIVQIAKTTEVVVGAGVSTCAPQR
jgi:hypothetical protein